ncbi:hypothetical protein RMN57_36720 [Kitasatospora sp. CM 4170]|uniref:Translation elongation factor EFG/EF2 domain-containing protein n=1 Tax=Kitasatospora aburaviensis TaxID=67265 RepID=A0ABW1F5W6_9ACTN|nr:hypothetical protein [Kitasatospora sp. CM 4170]WNM49857.1 hypothetical protein RMN57_36720 [Kitasatospora sp. CM 4170]
MSTDVTAFPPRPIRGVRGLYARQTGGCPCDFADVTVDFEPWEDGFVFEVAGDAVVAGHVSQEELAGFHAALVAGMREELAEQAAGRPVAVAVVLRRTGIHEVDSRDGSFRTAGRRAVRAAFADAYGTGR